MKLETIDIDVTKPLDSPTIMNGLQAAKQLLEQFEDYVGEGRAQIKDIAIEIDLDGTTRKFTTSAQYFNLAKNTLDTLISAHILLASRKRNEEFGTILAGDKPLLS